MLFDKHESYVVAFVLELDWRILMSHLQFAKIRIKRIQSVNNLIVCGNFYMKTTFFSALQMYFNMT